MERRELILDGDTWIIELEGAAHRVVSEGRTTSRVFGSPEKARRSFDEQIAARLQEGYADSTASAAPESRRAASLGQATWPLPGSLEQIVTSPEGNLVLLTRTLDSVSLVELDPTTGACRHSLSLALQFEERDRLFISARVAPNGRTLAVWGPFEEGVSVWDLPSATRVGAFKPVGSNRYGMARLSFSPDSSKLAVFCERLQVFAVPSGEELLSLPINEADPLAFSPDGSQIAYCAGSDIHIQPLDGLPRVVEGTWRAARQLAWSPTGTHFGVLDFGLFLVELESGKISDHQLPDGDPNEGQTLVFSADGSVVYVARGGGSLVRLQAGKLQSLCRLSTQVTSLALGPGEQQLYVGHGTPDNEFEVMSGELHRLQLRTGKLELLAEHGWRVLQADHAGAFLEQAPELRFNEPTRLSLWSPEAGGARSLGMRVKDTMAVMASRGGRVACSLEPGKVSVLEASATVLEGDTPEGFSGDGRRLLVQHQQAVVLYQLDDSAVLWKKPFKSAPELHAYGASALDPAGQRAVLTGPGSIQAYAVEEDRLLWEDEWSSGTGHRSETFVAVLGAGRFAVLCHAIENEDRVTCWCMETGRKLASRTVELYYNRALFRNLFQLWQPSAERVVLPAANGYVVWRLADGTEERQLAGPGGPWFSSGYPALSFDDRLVAVPEPGMVRVYSLPEGEQVALLETGSDSPVALAWVPQSYRLVTRGRGHSYQTWKVQDDPVLAARA